MDCYNMFIIRYRGPNGDSERNFCIYKLCCPKSERKADWWGYLKNERSVMLIFLRTCYKI